MRTFINEGRAIQRPPVHRGITLDRSSSASLRGWLPGTTRCGWFDQALCAESGCLASEGQPCEGGKGSSARGADQWQLLQLPATGHGWEGGSAALLLPGWVIDSGTSRQQLSGLDPSSQCPASHGWDDTYAGRAGLCAPGRNGVAITRGCSLPNVSGTRRDDAPLPRRVMHLPFYRSSQQSQCSA